MKQIGKKLIIAENRKVKFDFTIYETFDAGIVLLGTEVKSLREGKASIAESYATHNKNNEIVLLNAQIEPCKFASSFNHINKRERKLLLKRKEINKLIGAITRKGYSLIPLNLYFNPKGFAKIEIALAKGKSKSDKRDTEKKKDWQRQQQQIIRKNN